MEDAPEGSGTRLSFMEDTPEGSGTRRSHGWNYTLIEAIRGEATMIPDLAKAWVTRYANDPIPTLSELFHFQDGIEGVLIDDLISNAERFSHCLMNANRPLFNGDLLDKFVDRIIIFSGNPEILGRRVVSSMGLALITAMLKFSLASKPSLTDLAKYRGDFIRFLIQTNECSEKVTLMVGKLFDNLFRLRHRDRDPSIRLLCLKHLGTWISLNPIQFLTNSNTRYLGWALNDESDEVRRESVRVLTRLYSDLPVTDGQNYPLRIFADIYQVRIVQLVADDDTVASSAIVLVGRLLGLGLILKDKLRPLYACLPHQPDNRKAIGSVVFDLLINKDYDTSDITGIDQSEVHLRRLLQILKQLEPRQQTYLIDAVWDYSDAMKNQNWIVSMLLRRYTRPAHVLGVVDLGNLARLLLSSIRKAVGERIVPSSDNQNQDTEIERFETEKQEITRVLMKDYHNLLSKHMDKGSVIPSLVETILYMDMDVCSQNVNTEALTAIVNAFFKHGTEEALRSCVRALNFLSVKSNGKLKDVACDELKGLEDELIAKLKSALQEAATERDEDSLVVNLKRLYELQLLKTVRLEDLLDDFCKVCGGFRTGRIPDEVASLLFSNIYLDVAWSLHAVLNSETISEEAVTSLWGKRDTLFNELEYFVGNEGHTYTDQLACRVCIIIADAWFLFRPSRFPSSQLASLGFRPDKCFVLNFWKLWEKQVKVADETEDGVKKLAIMIAAAKLAASTDSVSKEYLSPQIISRIANIFEHFITDIKERGDEVPMTFVEALKKVQIKI
ncbi:Sister-chromatid cohesion protein 3 [Linum grandiflorum]